jgi:pimeloyl-ACP methyl ester carboxylesterase
MEVRVADVVAVLDELGIERAHFVGMSWGGRLLFGIGEHAPERVRSLVIVGQQPYPIDPDGPLARVVGQAMNLSRERGIEALVEAFEAIAGRYPEHARAMYLATDAAAMRAAWTAAMAEGAVTENLAAWDVRCLICVAADDVDFFDQARRAAEEIPNAEFVSIEKTDHLGVDAAPIDSVLPAVLRTLRETS